MARSRDTADERWQSPTVATRIMILHGKDRFLQDGFVRRLREALAKKLGEEGFDTVRFDGMGGPRILADVMDECRSQGLMQQFKVVVVENADLLLKEKDEDAAPAAPKGKGKRAPAPLTPREILEAYAEDPSDSAALVLRASTWRPGRLDKAVQALGVPVGVINKCDHLGFDEAIDWCVKTAKARHATSIDRQTATMLLEATGPDLGRIDSELEKLAVAAGADGQPITPELVREMTGVTREEEFFAIQRTLACEPPGPALAHLRDLLEISRQDPVPLMNSFVEVARKVHLASRGITSPYLLKAFGPDAGDIVRGVQARAQALGPAGAARLLRDAVGMDAANKSGLGEKVRNLEMLAVRYTAPAAQPNRKR